MSHFTRHFTRHKYEDGALINRCALCDSTIAEGETHYQAHTYLNLKSKVFESVVLSIFCKINSRNPHAICADCMTRARSYFKVTPRDTFLNRLEPFEYMRFMNGSMGEIEYICILYDQAVEQDGLVQREALCPKCGDYLADINELTTTGPLTIGTVCTNPLCGHIKHFDLAPGKDKP